MAEYYVFPNEIASQACVDYINNTPWFPIVGCVNGVPAPQNAKTIKWCDSGTEMASGEWAVPRVPETRLDALGVPQEDRDSFIAVFGQDIRDLSSVDFPVVEDDTTI
jgi:hypothetical protein